MSFVITTTYSIHIFVVTITNIVRPTAIPMVGGSSHRFSLLAWLCLSLFAPPTSRIGVVDSFSPTNVRRVSTTSLRVSFTQENSEQSPRAVLLVANSQPSEEEQQLVHALRTAGYGSVEVSTATRSELSERMNGSTVYIYELSKATGMLKLLSSSNGDNHGNASAFDPPTWVPMVRGEENVLVANGWSFLDPDEREPMSAFDIDDANAESEYKPKWGKFDGESSNEASPIDVPLSSLGFDLSPLSKEIVLSEADALATSNQYSKDVLLHGKTDPPNTKLTCNDYDFTGSAGQSDIPEGIFFTAIGGLPLFSSKDLAPTTASSGWLSFARPLDVAHVMHAEPDNDSWDQRIEVVCARSKCHLGHYFGPTEGYCINASALRFLPSVGSTTDQNLPPGSKPISWRSLEPSTSQSSSTEEISPSHQVLKTVLETHGKYQKVALGAGCFWHVEEALRNLQGVVATEVAYAGGFTTSPTYKAVCEGNTGHAEVVSVVYDPEVLPTNVLVDCFLAMHDATMVKAHGKHALQTGQYRSCVFVENDYSERVAKECLEACRQQLGKELSTEIRNMSPQQTLGASFGQGWCWRAEDEHQRYDERIRGGTSGSTALPATEWLKEYGRRTASTMGGSLESSLHPDDDGMAMMMI